MYVLSYFSKMSKSADLLQLCRGLSRLNKKSKILFVNNMNHNTIHQISEIYHNIQYLTEQDEIPPKLKQRLICGMRKHRKGCLYKSIRQPSNITKKKYFKKQIGNGLFTLLISAAIPLITSLISAFKNQNIK